MARNKKTATKTEKTTEKAEKKEKAPGLKYGINEMSEAMGVAPAGVRVKLRNADIEKVGGRYGWETKAEMNEVIDAIKSKPKKDDD